MLRLSISNAKKDQSIYKKIQTDIETEMLSYKRIKYIPFTDTQNNIVEQMRNAWLDPDYEFGGI